MKLGDLGPRMSFSITKFHRYSACKIRRAKRPRRDRETAHRQLRPKYPVENQVVNTAIPRKLATATAVRIVKDGDLVEEGIVVPPQYIPPQFQDLAALSAWMCYSLFLNKLDLDRLATDFKAILL